MSVCLGEPEMSTGGSWPIDQLGEGERSKYQAGYAGVQGNLASGNHQGTVTLIKSVEVLTYPNTYHS